MKLIVGLGNPYKRYKNTRHNVGFMVVDKIAKDKGVKWRKQFFSKVCVGRLKEEVMLAKPLIFMNNSGVVVRDLVKKYRVSLTDLLVVYDDVDLPLGKIRFKPKGGSGGHKGMGSIIECLGTEMISRVKVGIGRPEDGDLVNFVLSDFSSQERNLIEKVIEKAADCCLDWIEFSPHYLMNKYNVKDPISN